MNDALATARAMPSGWSIRLPVVYERWTWAAAFFPAWEGAVAARLPDDRLKPLRLLPGVALAVVGVMRYEKIRDVEPYDELVVGFPVERGARRSPPGWPAFYQPMLRPDKYTNPGAFVHRLPVSSDRAREFGVEIWGYPKTVERFEWSDTPSSVVVTVGGSGSSPGLTLEVPRLKTKPRTLEQFTYTVRKGELLRTRIDLDGQIGLKITGGGVHLRLGADPISRDLASMLCWRRAVGALYGEAIHSTLHDFEESWPLGPEDPPR